jgi:hypothetical protein
MSAQISGSMVFRRSDWLDLFTTRVLLMMISRRERLG